MKQYVEDTLFGYAHLFGLPLEKVSWLGPKRKFFGDCHKGHIRIQLKCRGYQIQPYDLIDTLSHELAHLRHNNHKPEWFVLHARILRHMAEFGVYAELKRLCKKNR